MAKCRARLSVESCDADRAARAVGADNLPYVRTRCEGGRVVTVVEVDGIGSMLATLDDILVNLKVASDVLCGNGGDE